MNGRYPEQPVFPSLAGAFPGYIPGTHSILTSSPRFPYNLPGGRTRQSYVPGSVVHGFSPYVTHARSPSPSVFGRSNHEYSFPERRSYVPDNTTHYRARDSARSPDSVVFNAGFTFRLGGQEAATVHKHVEVQPAYTIPEAESANLTRQIDKFLKSSDHTLDRYSAVVESRSSSRLAGQRGRSATPGGALDTSPDRSFSLSCRAQRSTSAASIAVKAEKHLESLSRVTNTKKTAPIAEREDDDLGSTSSESCNEFDTDEDLLRSGEVFDISDDTSADLSKLDDLSSDSDDEYFDVVTLPKLRPPLVPSSPPASSSPATKPQPPPHLPPTHSRSLPAVNKKLAASKMGNSQGQGAATAAAKPPETNPAETKPPTARAVTNGSANIDTVHAVTKTGSKVQHTLTTNSMAQQSMTNKPSGGTASQAPPAGTGTQTSDKVGISHKKYLAPQPPATTKTTVQTQQTGLPNNQEDNLSLKGLPRTPNEPQSTAPEKQQQPPGKSNPVRNPSVHSVVDRLGTDLTTPKREFVAASSENLAANLGRGSDKLVENKTGQDNSKARRAPSFKKYPAPQPPNSSSRPQSAALDGDALVTVSTTSLVSASSDQSLKKIESIKVTKEDTSPGATSTQAATDKNNATVVASKKPPSYEVQPEAVEYKNNPNATPVQSPKKQSNSKVVDGAAAVGRKVRAGSPVPDKPTVKDLRPTPAVVKGKIEISTNDGSATVKKDPPDEGKVSLQIKLPSVNKDTAKPSEAGKIETGKIETAKIEMAKIETDKKVNDKTPTLGKKGAKTTSGEDEARLVNGFEDEKSLKPDVTNTEKSDGKSSGESKKIEKQKNSATKEKGPDLTKENKVDGKKEEPQVNGSCDEVDKAKQKNKVSTSKEMSKQKASTGDKNAEKTNISLNTTDQKLCNGVHVENEPNNDNVNEAGKHPSRKASQSKESNGDVGSEERGSRCNSVANDISAAVSPDASKKSGYKRTKSGKLASVLNLFEAEDLSQASEKSKPKPSAPKVGKITGLASKFEGGAPVAPRLELSKMKSPYSGPFSPERKAPEPKTKDIAGINMAKFGNVAKFKKPVTGGKKDEEEKTQSSSSQSESKKEDNDKSISKEDASKKQNEESESENKEKHADKVDKKNEDSKKTEEKEENKKASIGDQNGVVPAKQKTVALVNGDASLTDSDVSSSDGVIIAKGMKKKKAKTDAVSDVTAATASPKISPKLKKKLDDPSTIEPKATETKTAEETEAKSETNKVSLEEPKSTDVKVSDSQSVKDKVSLPNNLTVKAELSLKEIGASPSETVRIVVNKVKDEEAKVMNNEVTSSKIEKIATIKTDIHEEIATTCDTIVTINVNKDSVISSSEAVVTNAEGIKVTDLKLTTTGDVAKEPKTICDVPAVSEEAGTEKNGSKVISTDASLPKDSNENASADIKDISAKSTMHRIEVPELAEIKTEAVSNATPVLAVGNSQATSTEVVSVRPKSLEPQKQELLSTNTKVESASAAPFNGEVSVRKKECSVAPEFDIDNRSTDSVYKYLGEGVPNIEEKPINHHYSRATCEIRRKINEVIAKTSTVLPQLESQVQAMVREASIFLESGMAGARASVSPAKLPPFTRRATSIGEDEDEVYEDAIDSSQLDTLMPLPDVPAERERRSRSRTPLLDGPERSPSTKFLVAQTEALLSETDRLLHRSRSDKSLRRSYSRSLSSAALNKLAEVTADLSEEHNTAHLAGERFEAEQGERMKLEKEVERLQDNVRAMTTANGRLEEERQVLKSEVLRSEVLNGDARDDDDDEEHDTSLYRRKYQWCLREMELLKKQLKQQQEDDLDHLLLLKKQLEKKVADAYEETEEQRQVVAQMKRKSQRLQAEMNDLKILLEEQTSRNNLLEKKQRKFDQDMLGVQEELRHERANKDKVQREKDQTLSEKYSFEQEVSTLKLELELKEEKVTSLSRELADLSFTGRAEEEVATLKKAKHDLDLRVKDQEEELDDLAGQAQMLEGARVRLEMSIEQMRKENRREVTQREEELEEVRLSAQKKVKVLENQLENEHEERTLVVREKHELERRVATLLDRSIPHVDEEYVVKLKKELKKTKALLRDTQTMLEKTQSEGGHKLLLRQLKTQLEDAEFAKTAAIKARQCAECDLIELGSQLEEAQRARKEAEDRCARIAKDRAEIQTQLEESEEEVAEVMKKYKAVVSQLSVDQITLSEQSQQISELEHEKQMLQDRLAELSSKVEVLEGETANIHTQRRLEMKIKEVESKLELEQTTRQRLESQIGRLKDQLERLTAECDSARMKESQAVEQGRRVGRQLREVREDLAALQQKHTDAVSKKGEVEKQLELADSEVITLKSDLKLAFKRIEDLQQAIQGDLNDSDSDLSDSDSDTDGSLSSYLTASLKHQRSSSNSTLRTPPSEVHQLDRLDQAASPSSEGMSAISEDLEETAGKESFA